MPPFAGVPLAPVAPAPPPRRASSRLPILLALAAVVVLGVAAGLMIGPTIANQLTGNKTQAPSVVSNESADATASPQKTTRTAKPTSPGPSATREATAEPTAERTERPTATTAAEPTEADLFGTTDKIVFSLNPSSDNCMVKGTVTSASHSAAGDLHVIALFAERLSAADQVRVIEKFGGKEIWNKALDQDGIDCFDYSLALDEEDAGVHTWIYTVNGSVAAQADIDIKP